MLFFPLHGTLDHHDGIGVVIVACTLALWTALSALSERMERSRIGTIPRRRPVPPTEEAFQGDKSHPPCGSARVRRGEPGAAMLARGRDCLGTFEGEARS